MTATANPPNVDKSLRRGDRQTTHTNTPAAATTMTIAATGNKRRAFPPTTVIVHPFEAPSQPDRVLIAEKCLSCPLVSSAVRTSGPTRPRKRLYLPPPIRLVALDPTLRTSDKQEGTRRTTPPRGLRQAGLLSSFSVVLRRTGGRPIWPLRPGEVARLHARRLRCQRAARGADLPGVQQGGQDLWRPVTNLDGADGGRPIGDQRPGRSAHRQRTGR
jgi:hypothetical protein